MTIEFKDYRKLVAQQAWKAHSRLLAFGIYSMEYEDVYQEMCVFYSLALKTYDSSKGFLFTTYLVTVMQRQFKRVMDRLVEEKSNITSVEEIENKYGEDGEFSLYDVISDTHPYVEDELSHRLDVMAKLESLSACSKLVINELVNPSAELIEEFEAKIAHIQFGKELGVANGRVPLELNIQIICDHYGIDNRGKRQIRDELSKNFGVNL